MENKMDSLFKKKLENNSLLPREDAWARVESNLPKKNNNAFVWRMAAALLIAGALITAGIFTLKKNETYSFVKKTDKKISKPASDSKTRDNSERKHEETLSKNQVKESDRAFAPLHEKDSTNQQTVSNQDQEVKEELIETRIEKETPSQKVAAVEQNLKTEATLVTQTTSSFKDKPIVLEFTLEEVVADHTAVAKTENKNSGLMKMLETMSHLKNGEGPVNQLLEKKDELFALNFKKEKQKNVH